MAILSVQPVRNLLSREQEMNTSYNPLQLLNTRHLREHHRGRYEIVVEGTDDAIVTPQPSMTRTSLRSAPCWQEVEARDDNRATLSGQLSTR